MNDKYTALIHQASEDLREVPADACALLWGEGGSMTEYRPGAALPAAASARVYLAPIVPVETLFAVHDAIECLKPDGDPFRPGFCFSLRMRYISSRGVQQLLQAHRVARGRMPDCITLEVFYDLLADKIRKACQEAATAFCGGQALPYVHWWQEIHHGTALRDALFMCLTQVFNSYGFRLDAGSLKLAGLAGIPAQ